MVLTGSRLHSDYGFGDRTLRCLCNYLFTFTLLLCSFPRIRFGKTAMKCTDCLGACHSECKSSMPTPCVPTCRTPTHFVGSIADYSPKTTPMIPSILIHCLEEIETRGLEEPGLYRTNAPDKEIAALKVIHIFANFKSLLSFYFCVYRSNFFAVN